MKKAADAAFRPEKCVIDSLIVADLLLNSIAQQNEHIRGRGEKTMWEDTVGERCDEDAVVRGR